MVKDGSYRFVVADDGRAGPLDAAGVVTFFKQPMVDDHILAVEALWFREDELPAQLAVWRALATWVRQLDFGALCISRYSVNKPNALHNLIENGALDSDPVTVSRLPLQKEGNPSPVYSAFADELIEGRAFISIPTGVVHTRKMIVDLAGREYTGGRPLYRGEGRLERGSHWKCKDLDALANVIFANGFTPRSRELPVGSDVPFAGTIAEQLLHQGYVGQGAVSLSTSFDVAARYAHHAGTREESLVFNVDPEQLRHHTRIFDARATLAAACPWITAEAWAPLARLVHALRDDLTGAGHFLAQCYEEAWKRANIGAGSLLEPPDVRSYLSAEARAAVVAGTVTDEELGRVYGVFEEFAEFAQQRIGAVDKIHLSNDDGIDDAISHRVGPMVYFEMFARILSPLSEARPDWYPGWDTTPFGYIAKTVRDFECFSATVPPEAIVDAYVVDRSSRIKRHLLPS
jgi:hypothetical protein